MSENIFAERGLAVFGDKFIGRKELLKKIGQYVLGPNRSGNLALVGIPAIGKSSLVKQFLYLNEQAIIREEVLLIEINLGAIENIKHFHLKMVTTVLEQLENLKKLTGDSPIHKTGVEAIRSLNRAEMVTDEINAINAFYLSVKTAKWEITFILDNFDEAKEKFPSKSSFQQLLALLESHYFSLITLSRERIYQIERTTPALSQLSRVLSEEYIPMLSREEVEDYLNQLSLCNILLTDKIREKAIEICGNHPFLLNLFCNHLVNQKLIIANSEENISFDIDKVTDIHNYFEKLNDWVSKISLHKEKKVSFDDLIRYHVVKELSIDNFTTFSKCFKPYLHDYDF